MVQSDQRIKGPGEGKKFISGYVQARIAPASIALGIFGIIVLVICLATLNINANDLWTDLLFLAGTGIIVIAILLYFFTPSLYLRDDVCDAMARSDVMTLNRILESLLIESKGIYVPASQAGAMRLFIPLSSADINFGLIDPGVGVFNNTGAVKGLSLNPPGHGLFLYALSIGAAFTDTGLENEIKDVMENGMEMAAAVSVKRDGDLLVVSMRDIVNNGMCRSIRDEDPGVCTQTGCPICSFVGCMIAAGTMNKTRIKNIEVNGKIITASFELLRG